MRENPPFYYLLAGIPALAAGLLFAAMLWHEQLSVTTTVLLGLIPFLSVLCSLLPCRAFYRSVFWFPRIVLFAAAAALQCVLVSRFFTVTAETGNRMPELTVWLTLWLIPPALTALLRVLSFLLRNRAERGDGVCGWLRNAALISTPHLRCEKDPAAKHTVPRSILFSLFCVLTLICVGGAGFLHKRFTNMAFQAILFTVKYSEGNGNPHLGLIIGGIACLLVLTAVYGFLYYSHTRGAASVTVRSLDRSAAVRVPVRKGVLLLIWLLLAAAAVSGFAYAAKSLRLVQSVRSVFTDNSFYENNYVAPEQSLLTFPEQKKNLIYLYVESMENTFTDYQHGGDYDIDYIPELYALEEEGINFSHTDGIGGASVFYDNVSFTMGSTVAQTSGVPLFTFPAFGDTSYTTELPGLRRIEDVLHDAGYTQFYMLGSVKEFAGYDTYVARYDDSVIYDRESARAEGYMEGQEESFWGLPDYLLLETAKDKLTALAAQEKPFYFSMYTMDTHGAEGGYRCGRCDDSIENNFAAALRCSSREVSAFIRWIQAQDFYKDTVIIMVGDHPAEVVLDKSFIKDDDYLRNTYCCILNSDVTPKNTKNRLYAANDMFPTALAAIGVQIEGDRLGFGTNLFSARQTLPEELGREAYLDQITLCPNYYNRYFWQLYD